jgi:pyrimidine oxygenase
MSGAKEFGIFLPIANGGWIVSRATPPLDGGWVLNRDAALLAEQQGFDFVMAMGKWRGFGGDTSHWGSSLEAVTMMAGIAAVTSRVKIWTTLHAILHNPAVAAKMIATLDHISNGRAGLNIVAGAYRGEFEQMGAWDTDLSHDARYDLAQEWTQIVKRLWSESRVSFNGKYFAFQDCVSDPKPLHAPFLICAGMSQRGFEFSVRECDACFVGGRDRKETREASLRAKALATSLGKTIKTYCMMTVIADENDGEALRRVQDYRDGVDQGAIRGMLESYGLAGNAMTDRAQSAFMTQMVAGSPEKCVTLIELFLRDTEVDGLMFIFDDYTQGLRMTGEKILPMLRKIFA